MPAHKPAAHADLAQRRQRVGGLAALRDGDVQRVAIDDRVFDRQLGGVFGHGRQARVAVHQVGAHLRAVQAGATGQKHDVADVEQARLVRLQAAQARGAEHRVEPTAHRAIERRRLLADLLQHEVSVVADVGVVGRCKIFSTRFSRSRCSRSTVLIEVAVSSATSPSSSTIMRSV